MRSNLVSVNLHLCGEKCWINVFTSNRRPIKMTPSRIGVIIENLNKRNFENSYNVISSEKIFISDFKGNIFRFIRNLSSNFNALIPLWIETCNIGCFYFVSTKFCNNISFDLTTYNVNRNKTLCPINFDCNGAVNKRKLRRCDCVLYSNELNNMIFTGSLIKAVSCTVIWSFYPKTAMFASK